MTNHRPPFSRSWRQYPLAPVPSTLKYVLANQPAPHLCAGKASGLRTNPQSVRQQITENTTSSMRSVCHLTNAVIGTYARQPGPQSTGRHDPGTDGRYSAILSEQHHCRRIAVAHNKHSGISQLFIMKVTKERKMCPIYQHLSPTGHEGISGWKTSYQGRKYVHLQSLYPRGDLATRHRREIVMTVVADSGFFFLKEKKKRKRKRNTFAELEF